MARAVLAGARPGYATFASGNERSLLRRIVQPIPAATDNANVHVVPMGPEWVAMTETERQLAIDPQTLEARGPVAYADSLPARMSMTAHPHFDFDKNLVVNVGTSFSARSELVVYGHTPESRRREVIGRYRTSRVPYVHSFGLSPQKVVIVAHPMAVHSARLLWSNHFIERFRWNAERGTRLIVMDRASGNVETYEADPFFVFHTVNAFHDGADLVLDLLAYPDATIIDQTRIDRMAQSPPQTPALTRIRMTPTSRYARVERLAEVHFELPSISYRAKSGRRQRYVWGASPFPRLEGECPAIVRVDLDRGDVRRFSSDGFVFGEPLFVAAPTRAGEDDGVVVTVGSDPARGVAKLVVLDARELVPLAEATIDVPLPLGFHGAFESSLERSR
jgi:beta,beta-carotene 9',10'-dioxygenase